MASKVDRKDSAFWWVKSVDPATGKRVFKSSGFRKDDPTDCKRADALVAELHSRELHKKTHNAEEQWESWVQPFLKRFCKMPRTYERYMGAWGWLGMYLRERRLLMPSDFTYQDALGYLKWRTSYKKRRGRTVGINTALNDMKVRLSGWGTHRETPATALAWRVRNPKRNLSLPTRTSPPSGSV